MATMDEAEIEDFLEGSFVKSFEEGKTRVYEFDASQCRVVPKPDFNDKPTKVLRYVVRDPESMVQSWKFWDLSRAHGNVYHELKNGNNGNGWTIMEVTREGLNKNTRYKVRGIK